MQVRQVIAQKELDVVTTLPEASIAEASALLREKNIGAVIVTAPDGTIAGILSERDIVRALPEHGGSLLDKKVADLMTKDVTTCTAEDRIDDVMKLMTSGRFRHLPVVTDGRLAGIISIGDVVKNRLRELESETSDLRQYISGIS